MLVDHQIDFIIVGGAVATAHGSARLTLDLDVVYSRDSFNLERIVRALEPIQHYLRGAPPGLPFEWSVETVTKGLNFTLITTLGALDLLGEIVGGGGYEELKSQTIKIEVVITDSAAASTRRQSTQTVLTGIHKPPGTLPPEVGDRKTIAASRKQRDSRASSNQWNTINYWHC